MRPPVLRAGFAGLDDGDIIVDLFAGGGGATEGAEQALGRPVDIAINHDPIAIAMHAANHPETRHYCEDVFAIFPREVCRGRRVRFLWASPDCTHHSKAKGGKPRESGRRSLANVVIDWADQVRPDVIGLENVEEFADWGPLDEAGQPDRSRRGDDFRAWVARLVALGYQVEWRLLVAADYGAPTTRKRLFLLARCDGKPIVWPAPTHGKGRSEAWRPASGIIDWSLPCPSIFDRARPLADATLRRIATGIHRYVLNASQPFIVPVTHPRDSRVHSIDEPLRTVTAAHRGELALVVPTLVQTGYGERPGQAPRSLDLHAPLGTVVAGGGRHALVATFLAKHYGGVVGHSVERPIGAVTTQDHHSLVATNLVKLYGTSTGASVQNPLPTVTAGGNHLAEVRTFLVKYYGTSTAQSAQIPLGTVTTRDHFGLVMVYGQPYAIADIGMRMLAPRELFAAQGFPADYVIDLAVGGKPITKTAQIRLAGNSVCPQMSAALVRANVASRSLEAA